MKKFLLMLVIFTQIALSANAGVSVSPLKLELNANNSRTKFLTSSFVVQADKNETIRFKVYPSFFKISENGDLQILDKLDTADCLVKRARFLPNEFTLMNGKPQKVRVTITDLKAMPDGESRMILFIEDVATKEVLLPHSNKNITAKLIFKTRFGIPVYVDKGKVVKVAAFEDLKVEENKKDLVYKVKLNSSGNSRVRFIGKGQIIKDGNLISEFKTDNMVASPSSSLFKDEKIPLENIKEPGDYLLRLILSYENQDGKTKKLLKEINFTIKEIPTVKVEALKEEKQTSAINVTK